MLAATDPKLGGTDFPKKIKLTGEQWLQVFEKKIQKETKLLKLNKNYENLSQEDLHRIEKEEIKKLKELFELAGIVPTTQTSPPGPVKHEDLVAKLTEDFQEKVKASKNLPSPGKEKITNKIKSALELFKPGTEIDKFINQLQDDTSEAKAKANLKDLLDALLKPDESQKEIFEVYNQFHPATGPQEEAVNNISDTMVKLFLPGGESHVAQYWKLKNHPESIEKTEINYKALSESFAELSEPFITDPATAEDKYMQLWQHYEKTKQDAFKKFSGVIDNMPVEQLEEMMDCMSGKLSKIGRSKEEWKNQFTDLGNITGLTVACSICPFLIFLLALPFVIDKSHEIYIKNKMSGVKEQKQTNAELAARFKAQFLIQSKVSDFIVSTIGKKILSSEGLKQDDIQSLLEIIGEMFSDDDFTQIMGGYVNLFKDYPPDKKLSMAEQLAYADRERDISKAVAELLAEKEKEIEIVVNFDVPTPAHPSTAKEGAEKEKLLEGLPAAAAVGTPVGKGLTL